MGVTLVLDETQSSGQLWGQKDGETKIDLNVRLRKSFIFDGLVGGVNARKSKCAMGKFMSYVTIINISCPMKMGE